MKKEIIRIQNGMIRQGRILKGPFFLQFCKGEISGIITDDSFEKEVLVNFFRCRNTLESGDLYAAGKRILLETQYKAIRKLLSETAAVISGSPQLFESLTVVDNIFVSSHGIRRGKQKKIAVRLMEFFEMDIPLHMKIRDLSNLQRLQIEILHAVASHRRLIIISDVNGILNSRERNKLRQLYDRLVSLGYAICQIESLNHISLSRLKQVQVIEKGKSVGCFGWAEAQYAEIACLVNGTDDKESYDELLRHRDKKLFSGERATVLELEELGCKQLHGISLKLSKGEITQINCRSGTDYMEIKSILTGKADPSFGRLLYEGKERSAKGLRREIAKWRIGCVDFTNPDNLLFENLSITENVCYPLCLKNKSFFRKRSYMKLAEDYIKTVMPDMDPDKKVKSLTQEQIMRLVLCKWILCKPGLLFLFFSSAFLKDEPDIVMDRILIELGKYGIPVLIITERYRLATEITGAEYTVNRGDIFKLD